MESSIAAIDIACGANMNSIISNLINTDVLLYYYYCNIIIVILLYIVDVVEMSNRSRSCNLTECVDVDVDAAMYVFYCILLYCIVQFIEYLEKKEH